MTHRVVISIINYRTPDLTIGCVESVLADIGDLDAQVVVVDNASGDDSVERLNSWRSRNPDQPVTLVYSDRNTGFSGGHNLGMRALRADWYLVLNSDAILRPGFLREILRVADAAPQAGFVAPRLEGEDGVTQTSCFRFHTPQSEFIRGACTGIVARLLGRHVVSLGPDPDPDEIEWASFACILLRGDMVRQLGPMDEGYFLYFEDVEYCLRGRRAGWGLVRAPDAVAVHFRGGSGPVKALAKARKRAPAYYYASRTRFFRQAHGPAGVFAANAAWYAGRLVAGARRLAGKGFPPQAEGEWRDIWINALNPLGPSRAPGE